MCMEGLAKSTGNRLPSSIFLPEKMVKITGVNKR